MKRTKGLSGDIIFRSRFKNNDLKLFNKRFRSGCYTWWYLKNSFFTLFSIQKSIATNTLNVRAYSSGIFECRCSNWLNPPIGPPLQLISGETN